MASFRSQAQFSNLQTTAALLQSLLKVNIKYSSADKMQSFKIMLINN